MTAPPVDALHRLSTELQRIVPRNSSPVPIAISRERDDQGVLEWATYIQIKTPLGLEFDFEGRHSFLPVSIALATKAFLHDASKIY